MPLYTKTRLKDRAILKWLFLANIFLFLNDLAFYFSVYLPKKYVLSSSFYTVALGYIPYLIWILSITIFLSRILLRNILNRLNFFKMLPFLLIINALITFLFFSSISYAFHYLSWESISHVISFMSEGVVFDLALLCLIYSEEGSLSLLLLGFITLISGDCFVNYSFLSQTTNLLKYGELLWLLGLIFILFGIALLNRNKSYSVKTWLSQTNTIKNRLAFWSFGTSILSFILFFTMAYMFSAIDEKLFLGLPLFIMMYSVVVVIFSINMGKRFETPFKKITANVQALMLKNDKFQLDDDFSTQEFIFLQKFIVDAFAIREQNDLAQKAFFDLTTQVAHDIRSPLAAINTALADVTSITENKRIMIKSAARRINDIANNLLLHSKPNFISAQSINPKHSECPELIYIVLDNIIAEKRYEYNTVDVSIDLIVVDRSYSCFSKINLTSFKRVLSNLINNSIEAVNCNGLITISLSCNSSWIEIIIEDNGCGIPPDILPKITEQGFSFNKEHGAGFGLSYTKQYLDQINATLNIRSDQKRGTQITMGLIRSDYPFWFGDEINIKHDSVIIVLDDDPSIHDAWNERFKKFTNVKLIHFKTRLELLQYRVDPTIPILYLIDYELLVDVKNGLDVIEELKLKEGVFLVTSCFEDNAIRARCESMHVKIIPKPYVPYINITQFPKVENKDGLVFIDDDDMMRMTWRFAAEAAGKSISTYSSFEEFIQELNNYSKSTIIYIDSDLGDDIKGEVYAKHLYDKGFFELHLATGHSKSQYVPLPWIKTVVGKEPPFN